jgi:hypothetical protein
MLRLRQRRLFPYSVLDLSDKNTKEFAIEEDVEK